MDAAVFQLPCGSKRYRVGVYDPGGGGGGKALICPYWVNTQQVAELYGVWMLIKEAARRKIPQVSMLQDNLQATWGTVNLKSRAHFWRRNRILKAMILHLRNSGLILHSVWVPSAYQPTDPLSRIPYFSKRQVLRASHQALLRWNDLVQNMHNLEYKGVTFVAA